MLMGGSSFCGLANDGSLNGFERRDSKRTHFINKARVVERLWIWDNERLGWELWVRRG
jgi:hypothetical protein